MLSVPNNRLCDLSGTQQPDFTPSASRSLATSDCKRLRSSSSNSAGLPVLMAGPAGVLSIGPTKPSWSRPLPLGESRACLLTTSLSGSYRYRLASACGTTRRRDAVVAANTSRRSRRETTALFTSSSRRRRSRSWASCRCADWALSSFSALSTATATCLATCCKRSRSASPYAASCKLPNPSAPNRRCAVVSGTAQKDFTPSSSMQCVILGKRVSSCMLEWGVKSFCAVPLTTAQRRLGALGFGSLQEAAYGDADLDLTPSSSMQGVILGKRVSSSTRGITRGCCDCQTHPPGDSSTGNSLQGGSSLACGVSKTCSRMVWRSGS